MGHKNKYENTRSLIYKASAAFANAQHAVKLSEAKIDLVVLDNAWEFYSDAKDKWDQVNSDDTMINLIGTWARFNREVWKIEEKYKAWMI